MKLLTVFIILLTGVNSCAQEHNSTIHAKEDITEIVPTDTTRSTYAINITGKTIEKRFPPLEHYTRVSLGANSFGNYLRNLQLKDHGAIVSYYHGGQKQDNNVYLAVVDKYIGEKNLHQCADAVMRLQAEYLYEEQRYDEIHFNFTNGFKVAYSEWIKGKRIVVNGNKVKWVQKANPANNKAVLWQYLELIFTYAGTMSLEKEMKPVALAEMQVGDVFIVGGSPGHAIIIVDMIINKDTKDKKFMLAQSYMPAQELQILRNPKHDDDDPWYHLDAGQELDSPEWNFLDSDLKSFNKKNRRF